MRQIYGDFIDLNVISQARPQFGGGKKKDLEEVFKLFRLMIKSAMCVASWAILQKIVG